MHFNIDFEIAAAVFEAIFIFFFVIKRFLPNRQNRLYVFTCSLSVIVVFLDSLTAVLDSNAAIVPVGVIHFANTMYFCLVPCLTFSFCLYCISMVKQDRILKSPLLGILFIPLFLSVLVAVTNPFLKKLYYIENGQYIHGDWYLFEFISNAIYILFIIMIVFAYRKHITKIQFVSTFVSAFLVVLGALAQGLFFNDVLLAHSFSALAMVIIYLSLQNPDVFLDRQSNMFNNYAFEEMSSEYMNNGRSFSIVYFWIDDFRNLDTLYGLENVNKGLSNVIDYINTIFGDYSVFRLENAGFVFLEFEKGDYAQLEKTIRKRFEKAFMGNTQEITFSISSILIPYYHVPADFMQLKRIMEFAIKKCNLMGAGSTVEVTDEIIKRMDYENGVERAVERAVANNSIQVYFQPIYSTESKKITSAEALARLFDEDLGFISPEEFIAKAEANGSIVKLGGQIFDKICMFLRDSNVTEFGLESVHVNLSPIQCMQDDIVEELIDTTDRYLIDRTIIDLEITETAGVENNRQIRKNMDELIDEKFSFSLDDYGTGYSNTSTIVSLPFKAVKIDKSLVWGYFRKQTDILPDIIKMFHNQKLELIMEGVETKEMVDALTEMGCHYLQGFYFSKPIPMREFVSYLRDFNRSHGGGRARLREKSKDANY